MGVGDTANFLRRRRIARCEETANCRDGARFEHCRATSTREQLRQHSQALAPDLWFGAFVVPGMCLLPQPFSILLPSSILTVILDTGSRSAETIRLLPTRLGRHTQPE